LSWRHPIYKGGAGRGRKLFVSLEREKIDCLLTDGGPKHFKLTQFIDLFFKASLFLIVVFVNGKIVVGRVGFTRERR